jgi:superfamily II DNA or RNA helicase
MKSQGFIELETQRDKLTGRTRRIWRIDAQPDALMRLKRIFPRTVQGRTAHLYLEHTDGVARDLEWVMQRWSFEIAAEDLGVLAGAADSHRAREEKVTKILDGDRVYAGTMTPAREPRHYQQVAADLALTTRELLLGDDLGLGKSMSGALILAERSLLPCLVVCPTHLPGQWVEELLATWPDLKPHIVTRGTPYDLRGLGDEADPDVIVMNYHKLRGWGTHLAQVVKSVIFDEAQELRRSESDKYRSAAVVAHAADVVVGLTATPIYNYAGEIWNIYDVIAPGHLGSQEEFAREWGTGYFGRKMMVKDPRALGAYLRSEGLFLRRTREEVKRELPEVARVPHVVDADEDLHAKMMEGVVDLARIILTGEREEAFVAAGEIDWRMRLATGVSKARYVADFVRLLLESEERVVLFGWHREVYKIWRERLADFNPVFYTGSESPKQKEESKRRFLETKGTTASRILVMSLRSGSGLDGLQKACRVAVFGELDWSPGQHDQCVGRLHRDGQSESVLAYFLVSSMGSDPIIADVLNLKRSQSEPLRDPEAEVLQGMTQTDRVRLLAESVLNMRATHNKIPDSRTHAAI